MVNTGSTNPPHPPPPGPYVAHDRNLTPVGAIRTDLTLTGTHVPLGTTDLQAIIDVNPAGTSYWFDPGTYTITNSILRPHDGDLFTGQVGTLFNGQGTVPCAFSAAQSSIKNVTIQNIVFDNYAPTGVAPSLATVHIGDGWIFQDCESRNSIGAGGIGVWLGTNATVQRNYIHHNDHYGVDGGGATNSQLLNNDIAYNNWQHHYNGMNDAGGTKFAHACTSLLFRNNYVHHNGGPGLWTDGEGRFITYDSNLCEYNDGPGIDHEVSYEATISNNTCRYNAAYYLDPINTPGSDRGIFYGSEISIGTSNGTSASPIEISSNTVIAQNANGIGLIDADRGLAPSYSAFPGVPFALANVWAHNNDVTLLSGVTAAGVAGRAAAFTSNNRFTTNTYRVPILSGTYWRWSTGKITRTAWQTAGQDTAGTFLVS